MAIHDIINTATPYRVRLGFKDHNYKGVLKGTYVADKAKLKEWYERTRQETGARGVLALEYLTSHPCFKVGDYDPEERLYFTDIYSNSFMDNVVTITKDELNEFCIKI